MSQVIGQAAFLFDVRKLLDRAEQLGYVVTLGEAARTTEQQMIYVQTGRSKTMNSEHLKRRAIDLNLFKDGKLCGREEIKPLGDYWESLNQLNRWGGNWRGLVDAGKSSFIDAPHFERRDG
jgi:peptidoglycan L-alanyl-D-glutamate endopeptidase CwlK